MTAVTTGGNRPTDGAAPPPDPFATPAPGSRPSRPRLLSHVGRWGRARRHLPAGALRVLDVGCAFGYGSAAILAGGPPQRTVVGVESDPDHLATGRRDFPWITILDGDAEALPVPDGCADAVLLLDVLEHLADPGHALDEARRALGPGGTVIVSVPHRGALHRLDALNAYTALRRRRPTWPPLDPATGSAGGMHRHFRAGELQALLTPGFQIETVTRTGLGLEELIMLTALVVLARRGRRRLPEPVKLLHLLVYILDDLIPWGPLGYNLTIRAKKAPGS
jgi:SAM-dependent methyltransferase